MIEDEIEEIVKKLRDVEHILNIKCKQIDLIFEMFKEYVRKDQVFFNKKRDQE